MTGNRIEMTSTEIQRDWSRVQAHLDAGNEVVVVRYTRRIALIAPYPEDTMNDTYPAWLEGITADEEAAPARFTNASDAKNDIRVAIEAGGAADADDYDIDAILEEAYEWKIDINDKGQELLNSAGFEQIVDADEFLAIVARNEY